MKSNSIHTELRHAVRTTVMGDPLATLENIIKEKKTKAFFSYGLANSLAPPIIGGALKEQDLERAIKQCHRDSDIYNYHACVALAEIQKQLNIKSDYVHAIKEGVSYSYQANKSLAIKPQCFYTNGDQTVVTWVQFCKNFYYSNFQFGLISQILKESYIEKFDNLEILIIDTSAAGEQKVRSMRHHFGSKLPGVPQEAVKEFFATYSEAIEMANLKGIDLSRRARPSKDDNTGDMFA